jgi:alpha-beta hydrolase superfamily lysophospholipase
MISNDDTKQISFAADNITLTGTLHLPPEEPSAVVVGCHGLAANRESPKQIALANRCTAEGMAYFRFDHRGCGESGGDFATDTSLQNRRADLLAAVAAIRSFCGLSVKIGLFGSSFGGTVCLVSADTINPFAIVTLAAPVENRSIRLPENSPESLKAEIHQNRLRFDVAADLAAVHHILVIHGEKDETVAVSNALKIHRHTGKPKKLVVLRNGDHRISQKSHQERVMCQAVGWFVAHLNTS